MGDAGPRGEAGRDGRDGRSIVSAAVNGEGHLILTLTNGQDVDVGPVTGPQGAAGRDGIDGKPGKDGVTGARGEAGRAGRDGKDGSVGSISNIEIGDVFPARINAKDLDRLMVREITVNGETFQVLVPN